MIWKSDCVELIQLQPGVILAGAKDSPILFAGDPQ